MASLPVRAHSRESNPPVTTGSLVTGDGQFLADLVNGTAVLTLNTPAGERRFWVAFLVHGGRAVGLRATAFGGGEVVEVTFEGGVR
jgi:hypothetical protein